MSAESLRQPDHDGSSDDDPSTGRRAMSHKSRKPALPLQDTANERNWQEGYEPQQASEASLGRRCKAKARPKPDLAAAMQRLSRQAAEEQHAAQRDAEFRDAWGNEVASQADPWADMAAVEPAVDNLPGSVMHADAHGCVSILVPPGSGVPCTSCHAVHRGPCSFHDLLRAEIAQLKLYADQFVPQIEEFRELRCALYHIMATINGHLAQGGLTLEKYTDILLHARCAKRHCEQSVSDFHVLRDAVEV